MQSFTVEIQIDADAVNGREAADKVRLLLQNELQDAGVEFRVTAVFDEMGERWIEAESFGH